MGDSDERARLLKDFEEKSSIGNQSTDESFARLVKEGESNNASTSSQSITKKERRSYIRRWLSIAIIYFTMFMSSVTFSIVLSSLWPYLLEVDATVTTEFLGGVVAVYSVAQLIASPVFGTWSDYRPVKEPLLISISINILANIAYSYVGAVPSGGKWVMMMSRFFVGFGAGNVAVARAYVSGATSLQERTGAMAGISACQALGFIIGPALGLAFQPLENHPLTIPAIKFTLSLYTGPGFLSALLGLVNLVLLIFLFKEYRIYTKVNKISCKCRRRSSEEENEKDDVRVPSVGEIKYGPSRLSRWQRLRAKYDLTAVAVSISLFFVVLFIFAIVETLASPLSLDEFGWGKSQSTFYNNMVFLGSAFIAIATFIAIKFLSKWCDERNIFIVGFFLVAIGLYITLPFPGHLMPIKLEEIGSRLYNTTKPRYPDFVDTNSTLVSGGCDLMKQPWCAYVPAVELWQYLVGFGVVSIGYPIGNVMSYSIFSKILGSGPQGAMMGALTAAGSLARAVGPLVVTSLYFRFGTQVLFATCIGVVSAAILLIIVTYRKLVPNARYTQLTSIQ